MSSTIIQTTRAERQKKIVIIAGPTATGKSDVAALLCERKQGIIVSADSVQAYRGVQIGANKPTKAEQEKNPHLLIDIADHNESYNAADWSRDAIVAIESLLGNDTSGASDTDTRSARGETISGQTQRAKLSKGYKSNESILPVVCGGTMMYIQWLVHGRPDAMKPSEKAIKETERIMSSYEKENDFEGAIEYVGSLGEKFAERANSLCKGDFYRLKRTLEVALTVKGQPNEESLLKTLYSGEREGGLLSMGYDVRCYFLCPDDRMNHTSVVDQRCEQMIVRGLLQETTDLVESEKMPEMAKKAIGYRQTLDYLFDDSPASSESDRFNQFLDDFAAATRRYAKQQMSWFRRDEKFMFVPVLVGDKKEEKVNKSTSVIESYNDMTREDFEMCLQSSEGDSARCKKRNIQQGKKMKFYHPTRYILKEGSNEFEDALTDAVECRRRIQKKRKTC